MSIQTLLDRHAASQARGRAARLAGRVVLLGAGLLGAGLALERAGVDVPGIGLSGLSGLWGLWGLPDSTSHIQRLAGWLAISIAGLLQGLVWLCALVAFAYLVRAAGGRLLRARPARVAADLDGALGTDRFSAALEARGPLAAFVQSFATAQPPPADALGTGRGRRRERWLRRLAIAFVLLVALAPGRAPAGPGDAPVAAVPPDGAEQPLVLKLLGEKKRFWPDDPVPVQIVAEATMPPASDLDLPVRIRIDDLPELRTRARLFLPAGVPGQDAAQLDLRALVKKLKPGEHRAVARAGGAVSNPYFFTIEPPGGGGAGRPPPPKPQEKPQPKKPDPGGGSGQEEWRPKFVEPLVREGETIEKKARVPIERPGGGEPEERTLAQAWPELERRKEAALNRPGLSPAARKLVQEYFEQLRPR